MFESNKVGNDWSEPKNLGAGVNTSGWEAQPSLSSDGNELYFVSERKGGLGGYDIWYSRKGENENWTKAVNLGAPINTPFDEIAPYIHVNNQNLYFASNGLPGFGSYDIYVSEKNGANWQSPQNMGAPLNDFDDQYSFTVTSNGKFAYYSKEQGRDHSQIFTTPIPEEFQVYRKGNVVSGQVLDALTKKPLKAKVEVMELSSNTAITSVFSDSITGNYLIVVPSRSEYALFVNEPGYLFASRNFNYADVDVTEAVQVNIELFQSGQNSSIILENIFFETNQFELLGKSTTELDHLVNYLQEDPSIRIEISGHTDNEGSDSYNQQLSLKRANSVGNYLRSKGIGQNRVVEKGYGSKKPLLSNDSKANRQKNRRIELLIIK
ncbi:MAG: OmpA family protein [Cyclobacteriaceae bacterium]|nr:OmpA family protein [Cyclobacteriaceae bacterium]